MVGSAARVGRGAAIRWRRGSPTSSERSSADRRRGRPQGAMAVARVAALRRPRAGLLAAALLLPAAAFAAGEPAPTPAQLDAAGVHDIIVKRRPGLAASHRAQIRAAADVTYADSLRLSDTEIVHADPGRLADALAALRADPSVVYAEPDAPVHAFTGDEYWPAQWALENDGQSVFGEPPGQPGADIHAPAAWALGATGAV